MTDTTIADTTQEVTDATQEAVKQVNQLTQYVQDSIPGLITFGLKVRINDGSCPGLHWWHSLSAGW